MKGNIHQLSALFIIALVITGVYGLKNEKEATREYLLGQIGVQMRVKENQYNTLAKELGDWEKELDTREKTIERNKNLQAQGDAETTSAFLVLVIITSLLGGLLVTNFYLDWKRKK